MRTIVRSDDSSGDQGDQVRRLLDLHAVVADAIASTLDPKARRHLARWLHNFVFSGWQDVFEIDVDRYAEALADTGVGEYRRLLDRSAEATGDDAFAVRYARGRLAVLDRDPAAIIAVIGEGLRMQHQVVRVVEALDDAGMPELAVEHATAGLMLPHSRQSGELVQRLVDDAAGNGDADRVLELRREAFGRDPSSVTIAAFRAAAEIADDWDAASHAAE